MRRAAEQHRQWLETFEGYRGTSLTVVEEGREPVAFWKARGAPRAKQGYRGDGPTELALSLFPAILAQ